MTRIGRHPALRSMPLILVVCVGGGLLLGSPLTRITDGEVPYPVGTALSIVFLLALVLGLTGFLYRTIAWDPAAGTVTLAGRVVPLASVTRVVRSMSTGNGAAYLTYRFHSTDGPSARVLIAGRPMKGLDADGIAELIRLVEAAPIAGPTRPGGMTDEQAALADALTETGGKSEVGKRLLLDELRSFLPGAAIPAEGPAPDGRPATAGAPADPGAPPVPLGLPLGPDADPVERPRLSASEAEELERRWAEDDADAARYLAERPTALPTVRRILVLLIVVLLLVSTIALVLAIVAENTSGSLLDDDANDLAALAIVGPALVAAILYLVWCAVADAHVRRLQAAARAWLDTRDPDQRRRGLAAPLLAAWTQPAPGTRTARGLGFAGSVIGGLAFLIGLVLLVQQDETGPVVAATFTLGGGAVTAAGVVGIVWSYRRRREASRELVLLAGWRLDPPFVAD